VRGFERVRDDVLQLDDIERLQEVIVSAEFHRLDGRLRGAVGGHQNDEELGIHLADAAQRLEAVDAPHADVHEDEVVLELGNNFEAFLAGRGGGELDFRHVAEDALERILHVRFVVD